MKFDNYGIHCCGIFVAEYWNLLFQHIHITLQKEKEHLDLLDLDKA